jgi:hypothetical protein
MSLSDSGESTNEHHVRCLLRNTDTVNILLTSISGDRKNAFLKQLDNAPENLNLFQADMLDYDTVAAAFSGCEGVFHVASPVPIDKMVDKEASTYSLDGDWLIFRLANVVHNILDNPLSFMKSNGCRKLN